MGQTRIIIESIGSHHNGLPSDADKVAKDTVATLQAMGHTVTKAEFQVRKYVGATGEEGEPYRVDNLIVGPAEAEVPDAVKEQVSTGDMGWMDPAPMPGADRGTGEADENDPPK